MKKLFVFSLAALLLIGADASASMVHPVLSVEDSVTEKDKDTPPLTLEELIELLATTETGRTRTSLPFLCGINTSGELCVLSQVSVSGLTVTVLSSEGMMLSSCSASLSSGEYIRIPLAGFIPGDYSVEVLLPDGEILTGGFSL